MMTDNPAKVEALEALGVSVVGREPILVPSSELAALYLET